MNDDRPLFVQIAEAVEDQIVSGALPEGSAAPSTNALAAFYRINPATAGKGMRLLQDQGVVERRRGLGMFVVKGARAELLQKRRASITTGYVRPLVAEARAIGLSKDDLVEMVKAEVDAQAGELATAEVDNGARGSEPISATKGL